MADEPAKESSSKASGESAKINSNTDWDNYLRMFLAAVPPISPESKNSAQQAFNMVTAIAQKVPGQVSDAVRMLLELLQELTNIKGVEVQFQSWRVIDLRLHILKETDVPVNRDLAGIGKVEAVRLSKLIHAQAELGEGNRDLSLRIHEGLAVVLSFTLFSSSKQVIPLKGSAKLVRDEKGQLMVESSTNVPGTNMPLKVSFPLKQILDEIRKQVI